MTEDVIISYRAYLTEKRYAAGTIDSALRIAKRLIKTYSAQDLIGKDCFDVINDLGVKPSTTSSKHWYRYHINLYLSFLKTQEA